MADKSIYDVVFDGEEISAPKVRGTIEAWIEHKEEHNWQDNRGSIPVSVDRGLFSGAWQDYISFLNQRVKEDIYEELDSDDERSEMRTIFSNYWSGNEELQDRFKSISYWCHDSSILINIKEAEEKGGIMELIDEYGKDTIAKAAYEGKDITKLEQDSGDGEGCDTDKDQSSFGSSRFPELHDIGIVDDDGLVVDSKMRGLVIAFTKKIDEIRGESREFDIKAVQRAFLYWGNDKFDGEWIRFLTHNTENGAVYDSVKWVYDNKPNVATKMEKKYRGNCEIEKGNSGANDVLKDFLDTEAPGWDEDEDEETDSDKSKWEKFEEQAEEIESPQGDVREEEEDEDGESKWEKYEQESKEKYDGATDRRRETTGSADSDSGGSDDFGSGSSNTDNPSDLAGWAEKEGSTDSVHKPSRTRAGGANHDNKTNGQTPASSIDVECEDFGRPNEIQWPEVGRMDEFDRNRIYEGNTFEWSMKLPKNSVDTIVTSPPYYALRDYDIEDAFPISGDFTCDHNWENEFCTECGAFLGQLGHEPDPATFVDHIVDLMDRYKKVLKPTGSLWLNIGDTYAGEDIDGRVKAPRKSRMMIPERVYRRMVQTGWHLRDYVIWVKKIWMPDDDLKGNGKPFAGSSRLADQWEPVVRFTPQADHYADVDSNRLQPPSFDGDLGSEGIEGKFREGEDTQRGKTYNELGTNPPDVWLINSDGYDGDHRAVFPEELPKRCIEVSTPDRVCERCGIPYEKEVHVEEGKKLSAGGDYATYEQKCHCDAGHQPGVAFDPFLGSGTTAVAAANNGYDWAGVELSEKYQELARKRIPKGRQVGITDW